MSSSRPTAALGAAVLSALAFAAPAAAAADSHDDHHHPRGPKGEAGVAQKPPAPPGRPDAGSRSGGDRLFPAAGNGGYDVQHYDLRLDYDPVSKRLQGTTTITARATQSLREFSLDFEDEYDVTSVTVDGKAADVTREGTELIVDGRRGVLRAGKLFTTVVTYSGVPEPVIDPDGSSEGWLATPRGAAFVVGQPIGAQGWFPNNNTPADKATFEMRTTVPANYTAIGNGVFVGKTVAEDKATWHWREDKPMSTYLATSSLGPLDVTEGEAPGGVRVFNAVDRSFSTAAKTTIATRLARQPGILGAHAGLYGAYPFSTVGAAVINASFVGYALESQSISNYDRTPSLATISHEIAHQWYGNAVTPREWIDIWLNEGFATWIQWDWSARNDGRASTTSQYDSTMAVPAESSFWKVPPGSPAAEELFAQGVYQRGAATLEALRLIVGENVFRDILRRWYAENKFGLVETADFVALSERVSGKELSAFFQDYLYDADKPARWEAYAG